MSRQLRISWQIFPFLTHIVYNKNEIILVEEISQSPHCARGFGFSTTSSAIFLYQVLMNGDHIGRIVDR